MKPEKIDKVVRLAKDLGYVLIATVGSRHTLIRKKAVNPT